MPMQYSPVNYLMSDSIYMTPQTNTPLSISSPSSPHYNHVAKKSTGASSVNASLNPSGGGGGGSKTTASATKLNINNSTKFKIPSNFYVKKVSISY